MQSVAVLHRPGFTAPVARSPGAGPGRVGNPRPTASTIIPPPRPPAITSEIIRRSRTEPAAEGIPAFGYKSGFDFCEGAPVYLSALMHQ